VTGLMFEFADTMTLREARDELRGLVDHGHRCPCCTQFAKVYRRKLHSQMAVALIKLYRAGAAYEWVHLPAVTRMGGDSAKARYWGLIVEETERRDDGGRSGWWQLTEDGIAFVTMRLRVPKYARVYDGRCLGLHGEPVTICECLGSRFSYDELMADG
jgi:hypothetical protein